MLTSLHTMNTGSLTSNRFSKHYYNDATLCLQPGSQAAECYNFAPVTCKGFTYKLQIIENLKKPGTHSFMTEGCESSSPPITITPFNLTLPVNLLRKVSY